MEKILSNSLKLNFTHWAVMGRIFYNSTKITRYIHVVENVRCYVKLIKVRLGHVPLMCLATASL